MPRGGPGIRPWGKLSLIIIIAMMIALVLAQTVAGAEDRSWGPEDVQPTLDDEFQVLSMGLTMNEDTIIAYPSPGRSGEAVVTGTLVIRGVPPNTQVKIEAEIDMDWEVSCSPESIDYVRPQTNALADISVRVMVPPNELAGVEGVVMVTVTASSPTSPDKTVNAAVIVRVGQYHDIDVEWWTKTVECYQNDSFKIKGTITNNGNGYETLAFIIERPFPGVLYIVDYADAPMNETTEFSVTVEVPHNASIGDHHLKIHCFSLDIFDLRQISAKDIDLEVIEERGAGSGMIILGVLGLFSLLGVAFYVLRREKLRKSPGPEEAPSWD